MIEALIAEAIILPFLGLFVCGLVFGSAMLVLMYLFAIFIYWPYCALLKFSPWLKNLEKTDQVILGSFLIITTGTVGFCFYLSSFS